jgi:hypothetical protein
VGRPTSWNSIGRSGADIRFFRSRFNPRRLWQRCAGPSRSNVARKFSRPYFFSRTWADGYRIAGSTIVLISSFERAVEIDTWPRKHGRTVHLPPIVALTSLRFQEADANRMSNEVGSIMNAKSLHEIYPVGCGRLERDPQLSGNLLARFTFRN